MIWKIFFSPTNFLLGPTNISELAPWLSEEVVSIASVPVSDLIKDKAVTALPREIKCYSFTIVYTLIQLEGLLRLNMYDYF